MRTSPGLRVRDEVIKVIKSCTYTYIVLERFRVLGFAKAGDLKKLSGSIGLRDLRGLNKGSFFYPNLQFHLPR